MNVVFADAFYFVARLNRRGRGRRRVREFILHLRRSAACEIVPATREGLDRALDLYHQHTDKGWTLTDCVSFIVMRERNVAKALTGDRHFEQAGFAALLK